MLCVGGERKGEEEERKLKLSATEVFIVTFSRVILLTIETFISMSRNYCITKIAR
jgi:hypothetical protein